MSRSVLLLLVILLTVPLTSAQNEEDLLNLPKFGYLLKPSRWQFLWDHPYAPAMQNEKGTTIVRLQSGDTLEIPLTVEAVGDDPRDALDALGVEVIGEPREFHFDHEDGMPLDGLLVETKLNETTNRLIVLALPPYQEDWYLITVDAPVEEWDKALHDAEDILETFRYIPNAPLLRVVLGYSMPEGAVLRRHELETLEVISQRLYSLELETPFTVHLLSDQTVEIGFYGGVKDVGELAQWLTQVGFLELVDFSAVETATLSQDALVLTTGRLAWQAANLPAGTSLPEMAEDIMLVDPLTKGPFETLLTSADFEHAEATLIESMAQWQFLGTLLPEKRDVLKTFTSDHIGEVMAVVLDGHVLMTPTIQVALSESFVIAGNFSEQEIKRLAVFVKSGPLPVPLVVETIELLE